MRHRPVTHGKNAPVGKLATNNRILLLDEAALDVLEHLFGGDAGIIAPLDQMAEHLEHRNAGSRPRRVDVIHFERAPVERDNPQVLVEHAQPMGHVLDRGVEQDVLLAQRIFVAQPNRNILVVGDPAAFGHGPHGGFDHPAVLHMELLGHLLAPPNDLDAAGVKLVDRQIAMIAELYPMREDVAVRNPRLHHAGIEAVDPAILRVAHDQPLVGAEQAQAVRHVAHRAVEPLDLHAQLGFQSMLRGDIFVDRDPAATRQRLVAHRDRAAVRQRPPHAEREAGPQPGTAFTPELVELVGRYIAALGAVLEHRQIRHARPDDVGREVEHFEIAMVEHRDAEIGIEHAQAVRHAVERDLMERKQSAQPIRLMTFGRLVTTHDHSNNRRTPKRLRDVVWNN